MRKFLLVAVAASLLAPAAPSHAYPYRYVGGCSFNTVNGGGDDTETTRYSEVSLLVAATGMDGVPSPEVPIHAQCEIYKNSSYQDTPLTAAGVGVAGAAGAYTYQADADDVITVCTIVVVGGERQYHCEDPTTGDPSPYYYYEGGCGFTTVSDGGDDSQTTWQGEFSILAVATNAAGLPSKSTPISVECEVYKNGVNQYMPLTAYGTGVAVNLTQYAYQASPTDVITICENVYVAESWGPYRHCGDASADGVVPERIMDLLDDEVLWWAEPEICAVLGTWAPGVLGVVDIGWDGDVFVNGTYVYDCPPYGQPSALGSKVATYRRWVFGP